MALREERTKRTNERDETRRDETRRGKARRGEARRGEARRGEARRGEARLRAFARAWKSEIWFSKAASARGR